MSKSLTPSERAALDLALAFPTRALTSSFVADRLGDGFDTRRWATVLGSLARRGLLIQRKDSFVARTFWTLPSND